MYARVHAKGAGGKSVSDDFTPEQMREEGVETTKNWFYKVASIRELVPRFYVELAIIRCYRMLMPASELPTVLRRMVQMVRGFGDPLAATYARSYLVHKAMQVAPHMTQQLVQEPLWDTFTVYKQQLANETFQKKMAARVAASGTGGTLIEYFQTFIPALEWLTQVIAERNPTHDMLKEMIKLCVT